VRYGLFCKSFRNDLTRFERLYDSVDRFDRDGLPFLLSVPECDRALFESRFGRRRLEIITDEALVGRPIVQNWRMQQIVKLHAWTVDFADALVMLDSDFYFIRPFGAQDFAGENGMPRFVLSRYSHRYERDNAALLALLSDDAQLDRVTSAVCERLRAPAHRFGTLPRFRPWLDEITRPGFYARMRRIRRVFGRSGPDYHVMPGPIWTRDAQRRFRDEFLSPRRLRYEDLVRHAPWEYVWLAEWLLATGLSDAAPSEPLFLHFASDEAIAHARAMGFKVEDFARHYVGLALASRHQEIEEY
jgi:hypothetical protein